MCILKRLHFWLGITGILVFLLTGQYMSLYHNHLQDVADGPRMLYRSAHIYILLTSIINLVIGVYMKPDQITRFILLQYVISLILFFSPLVILIGFYLEPQLTDLARPYTRTALFALFGVAIFLVIIGLMNRNKS